MTRLWAGVLALAACQHWHYERNAPGHIDLAATPTTPIEEPSDPGENFVVLSPGAFVGGGPGIGGPNGNRGRASGGAVVSLEYGWSERSHVEDELFGGILPQDAVGLALGWNFYENDLGQRAGPLFFDLQYRRYFIGVDAGWAYDPQSGTQGPHAMTFFGPFYLDLAYLSDRGTTIDIGIMIRGALTWVWSR